jgi:hypothetical protein
MVFLLYGVPVLVFIFTCIFLYTISNDTKKDKPKNIISKNVLPAIVLSLLIFIIIKYKDTDAFNSEPVMSGNYFD